MECISQVIGSLFGTISRLFYLFPCSRKCITGFIPETVLRRSRDKFLNFPTRNQRKLYISNLRTIVGFSCCCLFPVACAIAHITSVLNSKYHSNSPEIKLECYNKIQWHQSIVFPVCVYDLAEKVLHWEVDYSPFAKGVDWDIWGSAAGHWWSARASRAKVRCEGLVWWRIAQWEWWTHQSV